MRAILLCLIFVSCNVANLEYNEIKREVYLMSEFSVSALVESDNYGVDQRGKVYSIENGSIHPVINVKGEYPVFEDFFKIKDAIYFKVKEQVEEGEDIIHCFGQEDDILAPYSFEDFPEKPAVDFCDDFKDDYFEIKKEEYKGEEVSYVSCTGKKRGYIKVDNFAIEPDGLFFSVSESFKDASGREVASAKAGVWYCTKKDNRVLLLENGRLW